MFAALPVPGSAGLIAREDVIRGIVVVFVFVFVFLAE